VGDGLGSDLDDLREASAFDAIQDGGPAVFSASTASLGFTGAASGAFSFVHACLSIKQQVLPPLINCIHPDPRCKVRFLPTVGHSQFKRAMVWNSDRGIKNVAIILGSS
jgi:3-oxoacyl-(acyl-carrier-protein) synthase